MEKWTAATFKKRQLLHVLTRRHFIKIVSIACPTRTSVRHHLLLLHELLLRWSHRLNCRRRLLAHHRLVVGGRWCQRLRLHRVHRQRVLALQLGCRRWRWVRGDSLLNRIVWLVKVAIWRNILVLWRWRWILTLENRWNARGDVQVVEWIWLRKKLKHFKSQKAPTGREWKPFQTFVNEKIVCWFDCWSLPAVDLLLFPFMSFAKLNFDMFTNLLPVLATKSKPLWNDGDFGMFEFSFCSIFSSSGVVDTFIAWTILHSTPEVRNVSVAFKRTFTLSIATKIYRGRNATPNSKQKK